MNRLFTDHIRRNIQSLDGIWKFAIDPQDVGEAQNWQLTLPNAEQVTVPSVWNTQLGLLEYEGAAWYEKEFYTEGGCLRIVFDAVMTEADVWLDGQKLGYHYGGFTQFYFIVPAVEAGWHTLTVRADIRFDALSIPQEKTDWFHYGGITRSVTVERLQGICTLQNRMEYTLNQELSKAEGHFVLELYNAADEACTDTVTIRLGDTVVYQGEQTIPAHSAVSVTTPTLVVENPRLWSVEDPQLYDIAITTGTDDLLDRTGFRFVEVRDGKIFLNHKPLFFRGVNRHEDHPEWGAAFPEGLMKRDLDIIEDLGCNAVRGSHYPNAKVFVDMLDERGLAFWSEIPMWGGGFAGAVLSPELVERGLQMHREMVAQYYNHPCILIWGMHNEIGTDTDECYAMTKKFYAYLKENGGNRLVTYAIYKFLPCKCLELCDFISLNRYAGWYWSTRDGWQEELDSFRKHREELGLGDKPVIYSEFGGAAIYGHHTFDDLRGTEEYQAELLEKCMTTLHQDPMVVGTYVWQFCDTRTCRKMGLDRARTYNNKGILNEFRKPKMAYYTVRKIYKGLK